MSCYRLGPFAEQQLDHIYEYTAIHWGEDQADRYVERLFQNFSDLAARNAAWRAVPPEFGVEGFFGRCEHHFVYWRLLDSGEIGIVAILHERMHQIDEIRNIMDGPV
jgi:toxin ParE1/3/4